MQQKDNFSTIRITDSRISTITDQPVIGVFGSGADITKQAYNATSISNSALIFSCPIPSPNILIDREIYIQADMYFTVSIGSAGAGNGGNVPAGTLAFNPGYNALQSFPLNQSFLNSSVIINNTNVSLQSQAIVPQLLQLTDCKTLCKYNLQTAAYPDKNYLYYNNSTLTSNNPIGDYTTSGFDEILYGRGATPVTILTIVHNSAGGAINASLESTNVADYWTITCKVTVYEPVLNLSPFVFSPDPKNNAAIYGISQLNFNFTVDSQLLRFWSSIYPSTVVTQGTVATNGNMFANVSMNFNFLSAQPSDIARIPNKNIVPYESYTLYLNNPGVQFVPTTAGISGAPQKLSSNTISLAVVPDLFLIYVRIPMAQMTSVCSNGYFTIQSINVYYNNKAGILSNCNSMDLYRISVKNGLKMSWFDWCGVAAKASIVENGATAAIANRNTSVAGLGSLLVLSATDLGLPDMLAPGSQYQGTFRYEITVSTNYQNLYGTPNAGIITPDVCCICVESGILITENMQSSLEIGLLTANLVLNAKDSSEHIDDLHAQSGGNMQGRMRTNLDNFLTKHSARVSQPAQTGGYVSGGSQSGGKRIHKLNKYVM